MSTTSSITLKRHRCGGRACGVHHCSQPRRGISAYCASHERRRNLYGHPHGRHIRPKEYAEERSLVAAFIRQHKEHPAINAAVGWLDELLKDAASGRAGIAAGQFARLHQHGVSANDILVVSSALWVYSRRNPSSLDDDERLSYALGRAVLHLAPRESRMTWTPTGQDRRYR